MAFYGIFKLPTIIEQIPKNAQTYPIRAKSSSTGAWLAPH